MEFFRDTSFDFMGVRRVFLTLSLIAFIAALVVTFGLSRLNIGIDFVGGTQLTLKFDSEPELDRLRGLLEEAGLSGSQIQRFGAEEVNEVIIKTPVVEGTEEGSRGLVEEKFNEAYNAEGAGRFDLNRQGTTALAALLDSADPDALGDDDPTARRDHYDQVAASIMRVRQENGLLSSIDGLAGKEGVSDAVVSTLRDQTYAGSFSVLAAENVGPQIGSELRVKGILAVVFSLVGMLTYIWYRFELRFGIGALAALVHDVVICLGLYSLAGYEFNLTTIAAFLTVVGYSVNDSVVVFDRVRENLRRSRRDPLEQTLNQSLNQTLSRTVLTSGTTLLAVGSLFVFGGEVIRGLAFVLLIGVLIGTYSSIFVASPIVLMWQQMSSRRARS